MTLSAQFFDVVLAISRKPKRLEVTKGFLLKMENSGKRAAVTSIS